MQEQNMDFLFVPQMQNYTIHKYNMLTHMGAFIIVICKISYELSPRVVLDNVQAFLK